MLQMYNGAQLALRTKYLEIGLKLVQLSNWLMKDGLVRG